MYKDKVKRTYVQHKFNAMRRGIPFLLTFEQWCAIWSESGKSERRGPRSGQYCMARFGDKGGYEVGNVRICPVSENIAERNRTSPNCGEHNGRYGCTTPTWTKATNRECAEIMALIAAGRIRDQKGRFLPNVRD